MNKLFGVLKKLGWPFFLTVCAPVTTAILYFGFLASDVYVSESSFVVKSFDRKAPVGIGSLLGNVTGLAGASDDVYAVQDYAKSRDALASLDAGNTVRDIYSRPEISVVNRFAPFGLSDTREDLYQYFRKRVDVETDTRSTMTRIRVRAYRPDDARLINAKLVALSEDLVNQLNSRAQTDLVNQALENQRGAEARAGRAALALSAYRIRNRIVDPEKQSALQLQLVSKLQDDLIANQSQLDQIRSIVPKSSQIAPLEARIASLKRQIADAAGAVTGGSSSFAGVTPAYQRLLLESQLADKLLASAISATQEAREEASRKRIYLEVVVKPGQPDYAIEPHRLRNIVAVLIIGLMLWGVVSMLVAGVREHSY
jgi:capsular polysaccharide transport system permease protein